MKYIKLCGALILLLLANCAMLQIQSFIDEPIDADSIKLPIQISSLSIIDYRRNVDNRDINISWFALPGDKDEVLPKLSSDQRQLINDEFMKYVVNKSDNYTVRAVIEIVEGSKNYKCSWFFEDMKARSTIRITLYDSFHTPYLISATGEAVSTYTSGVSTKKYMEGLYQKAIRMALYKAVESISKNNEIFSAPESESRPSKI